MAPSTALELRSQQLSDIRVGTSAEAEFAVSLCEESGMISKDTSMVWGVVFLSVLLF